MVKDATSNVEVAVLVDGCRVPEMEDKDAKARDWDWLAWSSTEREVASVRACPNQHQRLIATTTDDYFEILVRNEAPWHFRDENNVHVSTYVDGHLMEKTLLNGDSEAVIEGQDASSTDVHARGLYACRRMRFAPLRPQSSREGTTAMLARASQAGRIDVVIRPVFFVEYDDDSFDAPYGPLFGFGGEPRGRFAPPPDTSLASTLGNTEKKRVFAQEVAFDEEVATGADIRRAGTCRAELDMDRVLATYSFRYAAIEGLHLARTSVESLFGAAP